MPKRFMSIWFRHLTTDWLTLKQPELKDMPFVFAIKDHGRMVITATTRAAEVHGISAGMVAADAKAIVSGLQVIDEQPDRAARLLHALGEWCIRYTPVIAIDMPDGLILDVSGCTHLWGGEREYLKTIVLKLRSKGYDTRAAMADTIGAAWAIARFGRVAPIVESYGQVTALLPLPPVALRLDPVIIGRLQKLGLRTIGSFIRMPRSVLRRRFGEHLLMRLNQALGNEDEPMELLQPVEPYQERLPCMEPINTATGIEIAIRRLLEGMCKRLQQDGKGLRTGVLRCYRVDGKVEQVQIGTNRASHHVEHLFKLFELKIATIEPALGIELFVLEAPKVDDADPIQERLWGEIGGLDDTGVVELLDRIAGKINTNVIHRYLPAEHYWPERSIKKAVAILEKPVTAWRISRPRPTQLLARPEPVQVTSLVPDYPPMLFIYKDKVHHIKKADGPERIEREWWLETGERRDYYHVEDVDGRRYWLFRLGEYAADDNQWFIHGFFA